MLPVELFLAFRYLRPRRSFVSIITLLSFGGVTIGVMVLIVVLSVMTGFRQRLEDKIISFNAHLTVAPVGNHVLYNAGPVVDLIKRDPSVVAAGPFIRGPVMVEHDHDFSWAIIKGVPVDSDDPVLPLQKYLIMGQYELRGDSVIVGAEWSRRNAVFPGDKLDLIGPAAAQTIMAPNEPAEKNRTVVLPDEPIVRGVFRTGQFDYDLNFMLVSIEMAQHLYGMGDQGEGPSYHGIAVRVRDPFEADAVKARLNRELPPTLYARTWMDDNRELFNAIATERVVMSFILYFVLLVAAFGLCSTLITITVQKSREIGLMKALGANDLQVCLIFILHSAVVGVVGAIGGTACALLLLNYRNSFRQFLLTKFHLEVFPSSVYSFADIPAIVNPTLVVEIALSAVLACVFAALVPAINVVRIPPARALRYE